MSELCLTSTPKTNSGFLSGFLLFSSLIPSPLLYFSYFVFFSPYLLKFLSFLSPLLITALLLLLGLLTVSPVLSASQLGFLLSTYNAVAERLRTSLKVDNEDEEFHHFEEELEAYRMVFETSTFHAKEEEPDEVSELKEIVFQDLEAPALKSPVDECSDGSMSESLFADVEEKTVEIVWQEIVTTLPFKEASNRLEEGLLKEFENMRYDDVEEEEEVDLSCIKSDKVEDMSLLGSGSEANGDKIRGGGGDDIDGRSEHYCYTPQVAAAAANPQKLGGDVNGSGDSFGSSNLGSYGSVRRDKEWKRTLACKLFEERHSSADGGEGMDLLWETHDVDSSGNMANKMKSNNDKKKNKNKKEKEKSSEYEYCKDEEEDCIYWIHEGMRKWKNDINFNKA